MIYDTPTLDAGLVNDLEELDRLRAELGAQVGGGGAWLDGLRRQWRASSAESSIEIEGFSVPADDRVALVSGDNPPDPTDDDRMALACYARAMDHVGVMADDPDFRWVDRVVLDLHFDACSSRRDRAPGRYRCSGIEVTRPGGGPPAYVGPPFDEVPGLMTEVVDWLEEGDLDAHVAVRGAMAHLHVVSVHPFRDGNGRISRIVQSLVLARGGPLAPELISIEEYLGRTTEDYYAVLQEVQGGSYLPTRDARPWVRFCVTAHIDQARRRLDQIADASRRWSFIEGLIDARGWPDRLVIALEQSLAGGVDRASYAAEAGVSAPTASNDLRRLLDAGLIEQRGKGRSTMYFASESLIRDVRSDAWRCQRLRDRGVPGVELEGEPDRVVRVEHGAQGGRDVVATDAAVREGLADDDATCSGVVAQSARAHDRVVQAARGQRGVGVALRLQVDAEVVVAVGAALARARGVEPEEIAEITRVNAARAFGLER